MRKKFGVRSSELKYLNKKFNSLSENGQLKINLICSIILIIFGIALLIYLIIEPLLDTNIFLFFPIGLVLIGIFSLINLFYKKNKLIEKIKTQQEYEKKIYNSNIYTLDKLSGIDFEIFCKVLFEKQGYSVETTKASGDYGIDLILYKNGIKSVGQCKRYSDKVSLSAVQEVVAGMAYYKSSYGFIITNNFFTKPAINLAEANNIQLIDRKKLVDLICKINNITSLELPKIEKEIIPKQENPPLTIETQEITKNDTFASFAFEIKNKIAVNYEIGGFDKINELIKELEKKSTNNNDDKITLHYFYQDVANILYSMRYIDDKAIDYSLILCNKDIENLKTINFKYPISITSLTRKCIILEKQNKIKEAIEVCEFAIKNNFLDNKKPFTIRKAKLENKLNNKEFLWI